MARTTLRSLLTIALIGVAVMPVVAQEGEPDEDRIKEIMWYVEARAEAETVSWYRDDGDYPRAIQNLRYRWRLRPWDEEISTDLIWMLGNIKYEGERLAVAMRFRKENPDNPDRGLPEAQVYWEHKMYFKIPPILEEDILRDPRPHGNTFRMIGHSYSRLGFHEDALRVWNQYLKHDPDDPRFQMLRDREIEVLGRKAPPPAAG
ncbi:MAG: hypothetical protein IH945_09850 [Armatimonadetes bacterium]|nr:hypothetical protein [Armatimonadota bacterium]